MSKRGLRARNNHLPHVRLARNAFHLAVATLFVVAVSARVSAEVVVPSDTAAPAQTVAATATETAFRAAVSRAFMNCLRDVDESEAELQSNPRAKESEVQYLKKYCESRRESCIVHGEDAQCKLFIEDYRQ